MMKIPAIRSKLGDWEYYVTTLTFEQVNQFVSKIDENLHKSSTLNEMIQRSISKNYLSIKEYILNQPSVFFNSLVLAVYDDYPNWREIEFKYEDGEIYQMGLLEFPGNHKIFPVDGQHRVEGIKAALLENPELSNQKIAAIFIGHKNDETGLQRTRRLFTTLNRYAKPVSLDDIIALDEDDLVAIVTRNLLDEYDLFSGNKIVITKQKAIPMSNIRALTSIITIYQANYELFSCFFESYLGQKLSKNKLNDYLKFRPTDEILNQYKEFCFSFWNAFKTKMDVISNYLNDPKNDTSLLRNNQTGGNLLFRPIGFLPFIKASLFIYKRNQLSFENIFEKFNSFDLNINTAPWISVLWNPIEKKMIMNSDTVTQYLLIYKFDSTILTDLEIRKLNAGYAAKLGLPSTTDTILNNI